MQLVPYLNFSGNCKEAFEFYQQVLGGQIVAMMTGSEMPAEVGVSAENGHLIMHARLITDGAVLMGSDGPAGQSPAASGIWVSLMVDSAAEAERIYQAFEDGGSVRMPMQETFWATRFGMVTDRFGTPWMINCEKAFGS